MFFLLEPFQGRSSFIIVPHLGKYNPFPCHPQGRQSIICKNASLTSVFPSLDCLLIFFKKSKTESCLAHTTCQKPLSTPWSAGSSFSDIFFGHKMASSRGGNWWWSAKSSTAGHITIMLPTRSCVKWLSLSQQLCRHWKSVLCHIRFGMFYIQRSQCYENFGVQHEFYKPVFVPLNNSMIFRGLYSFHLSLLPSCPPPRSQKGFFYSTRIKAKGQSLGGKDFRDQSRQVCQRHLLSYIGQNLTKGVGPLISWSCWEISAQQKEGDFPTQKSLPQNRVKAPTGSTVHKEFIKNSTRANCSFFGHCQLRLVSLPPPYVPSQKDIICKCWSCLQHLKLQINGKGWTQTSRSILEAKEQKSFKCWVAWSLWSEEAPACSHGKFCLFKNHWCSLLLPPLSSSQRKGPCAVLSGGGDQPLQHKDLKRTGCWQTEGKNKTRGMFSPHPVKRYLGLTELLSSPLCLQLKRGWGSAPELLC